MSEDCLICQPSETCPPDPFGLYAINGVCVITSNSPLLGGTVGIAYSNQLTVDAAAVVTGWSISNGTLPAGLTMNATGLITGTPTAVQNKTFTVIATVVGGLTCGKLFTLNILSVPIPVGSCAITARVLAGTSGASVSGTNITLHGGQTGVIVIEATPSVIQGVSGSWNYFGDTLILPGVYVSNVVTTNYCGGSFPATPIGVLVVSTCANQNAPAGSATFTVIATRNDGATCSKTFTVTIVGGGACNVVGNQSTWAMSHSVGQVVHYQCTYTGSPGSPLVWSISSGSLPPGLSLNSSTGVISGTISGGNIGTFVLTLNGSCSVALSWIIV